jgi:putative ABC transport system permease protein
VTAVGAVSHVPLDGGDTNGGFQIVGRTFPEGESPHAKKRVASAGYFRALGIPVVRGRDFRETDRAGARDVVILSRAIARPYRPGEDTVGRRVRFGWGPGEEQEVVGIVGDVRHDGLDLPAEGMIYRPLGQFPMRYFGVVVRTAGDPRVLAKRARREVHALDPSVPVQEARTLVATVRRSAGPRRTFMQLLVGFAAIALVLAAVGVYAITAQSVAQRTREIGVRLAVGARRGDILRLVVGEELLVIAAGLLAGLAGAFAATRALAGLLYRVSATDPLAFGLAALLLAGIGLAASYLPARRAARMDPLRALRCG